MAGPPPRQTLLSRARTSLSLQVAAGGSILVIALGVLVVAFGHASREQAEAADRSRHSSTVIAELDTIQRDLTDLETGVRAYGITGAERFLRTALAHRRTLPGQLERLRDLVADNPAQTRAAAQLERQVDRHLTSPQFRQVLGGDLVRPEQMAAYAAAGSAAVDVLDRRFAAFRLTEQRLARARQARADQTSDDAQRLGLLALGGAIVFILALVGFLLLVVVRPVRRVTLAVGAIAHGDRDVAVPVRGRGDVARLSTGINALAGALREQEEREARATEALRASEQAARQANELFRTGFEHAATGITAGTPDGAFIQVNPRMAEITGFSQEELLEGGADLLWTDELRAMAALHQLWGGARERVETEARHVHKAGHDLWLAVSASCVRDDEGRPLFILAQWQDVTGRRTAEEQLRQTAENVAMVSRVTRALPAGSDARQAICEAAVEVSGADFAVLMEPDGDALRSSAAAGRERLDLRIGFDETARTLDAYRTGEPQFVGDAAHDPNVNRRVTSAMGVQAALFQPVHHGGETVAVLSVGWSAPIGALSDQQRAVLGLLAAETAVAIERADLLGRLEAMARTDELTGLPNRRVWDEQLERELAAAQRHGYPLCVAMLDLDHFKALNDTAGHQAGDALLAEVSAAWRGALRDVDVLARWGGEEFAVALPACEADCAMLVAERLREAVPGGQTCSAGVARWDGSESAEELLGRADAALYRAKEAGRDRAECAEPAVLAAR